MYPAAQPSFITALANRGGMSESRTSNAYGVGIMTVIVGVAASAVFYQGFYLPESLEKPSVDEHVLHPTSEKQISIIEGAALTDQEENYVPKKVDVQLGVDNLVVWTNADGTAHTVSAAHRYADSYSGVFGSDGVIMPGETYEFLFTEPTELEYYCIPHPWMKADLVVTKQRF